MALMALGIAALIACLDMPRFEERQINPYTAPGLVPGMIAAVLALLGFFLTLRAARQRSVKAPPTKNPPGGAATLWVTLGLTLAYAAGLVGRVPFWLATGLFVFAFVAILEWRRDRPPGEHFRALAFAAVYAVAVAAAVTWVFPGDLSGASAMRPGDA